MKIRTTAPLAVLAACLSAILAVALLLQPSTPPPAPPTGEPASRPLAPATPALTAAHDTAQQPALIAAAALPATPDPVFAAFRTWAEDCSTQPQPSRETLEQGLALARERRPALTRLIESDPQAALAAALPAHLARRLPAPVRAQLETRVNARGNYLVAIADTFNPAIPSETCRYVELNGERYTAYVFGRRLGFASKKNIPLAGIVLDDKMVVAETPVEVLTPGDIQDLDPATPVREQQIGGPDAPAATAVSTAAHLAPQIVAVGGEYLQLPSLASVATLDEQYFAQYSAPGPEPAAAAPATAAAPSGWTTGPKTVLIIMADFTNAVNTQSASGAKATLDGAISSFYQTESYGLLSSMTATTTPAHVLLPHDSTYYGNSPSAAISDGYSAANAAGYNPGSYNLYIVACPSIPSWVAGIGNIGAAGTAIFGGFGWDTTAHELGHNYGSWHANTWVTSDGSVIGPGHNNEYGNHSSLMGSFPMYNYSQHHAYYKNYFGWLPTTQVTTVTASGTYTLNAYDDGTLVGSLKYALKINNPTHSNQYWLQLRRAYATNVWLQHGVEMIWSPWGTGGTTTTTGSNNGTQSLDTTPGSSNGDLDSALILGRTFADTANGIYITPISDNTVAPKSMQIVVNIGNFSGNSAPTAALAANPTSASMGIPIQFTVTANDANGDTLAYNWDFGDSSFGTNAAIVSHSYSTTGTRTVNCTVTDMKGGQVTVTTTVTITTASTPGTNTVTFQDGAASYTGTMDNFLDAFSPATCYGTDSRVEVDYYDPGTGVSETTFGLLKFDLSSIPAGATINSVTLDVWLTRTNSISGGDILVLNKVTGNWDETSTYNSGVPASVPSCVTTPSLSGVPNASPLTPSYKYSIPGLETLVQGWYDTPASNKGMIFSFATNANFRFSSREGATQAERPKLTVTYTIGASGAPTVATAASATPNPVSGTTTALSVLGADDGGEANLTYTWSSTGPASVTYSANGTNAAKNCTATFTKAGSYTFTATIKDAGNLTVTSTVNVTVNQTLTTITVSPATASVMTSATQSFAATAQDQFNTAMSAAYTWTVSGGGTISPAGLFTAGGTAGGPYTVTATSGAKSGTAQVTVVANQAPIIDSTASATPNPVVNQTTTSVTVVAHDPDSAPSALTYTWSKVSGSGTVSFSPNGTAGAATSTATFSASGTYTLQVTVSDGAASVTSQITGLSVTLPNTAPTVATAAAATPNPVTGTTTSLFVLGADDAGEPALTYTWAATGPATVTYSANGTNAAKSSTATFARAGSYTFTVTIKDAGNLTVTSTVTVTVNQTLTTVTVTPATASVSTGATQSFSAAGVDQFGTAASATYTWTVSGGGTISSAGLFTAGSTAGGPFTVTATSGAKSGTAQVTVTSAPNTAPTVATVAAATPNPVTGTTTSLSALGADDAGEAALTYTWAATGPATVTYSANGTNAAKSSTATFTKAGTYTFTVTIKDAGNLTVTSTVTVTVNQTLTTVTVSPATATIAAGSSLAFSATAKDQFGATLSAPPTVAWSVSGGGTISSAGLFTAEPYPGGPYTITATASSLTGTAAVTLTGGSNPITVNVGSVTLTTTVGSTTPVTTTVQLTNNSSSTVTITTSDSQLWLTTSPTGPVTLAPGGTLTVSVTADPSGLNGTFSGTVTITTASTGQSQNLPVSFNVSTSTTTTSVPPLSRKRSGCALLAPESPATALLPFGLLFLSLAALVLHARRRPRSN